MGARLPTRSDATGSPNGAGADQDMGEFLGIVLDAPRVVFQPSFCPLSRARLHSGTGRLGRNHRGSTGPDGGVFIQRGLTYR